jgi:hypothetical protein
VEFTCSPLDLGDITAITPLGNLNPRGGHVFPTDHIYLQYDQPKQLPVHAPAAGVVQSLRPRAQDAKIEVRVNEHFFYYLDHLIVDATVKEGAAVRAGQRLGVTSGRSWFDLGCVDTSKPSKPFINRQRYPDSTLHAVAPLALFTEPLRSQLYAKVATSGDRDGRIDFDRPGKLVGNWFLEGPSAEESQSGRPETWAKQLAFVPDPHQAKTVCVSIGGTIAPAGLYQAADGSLDPAGVSPGSGKIVYRVRCNQDGGERRALLLVQMEAADRVRVEFLPGTTEPPAGFTAAAKVYGR